MEIDSPPPRRLIQRLAMSGVPEDNLQDLQRGLVSFVKTNKPLLPDIVSAILPSNADIAEAAAHEAKYGSRKPMGHSPLKDQYRKSMLWLKWLMFEDDPSTFLNNLSGQHGLCGAVWGKNELAFQCRTCELDPTCAICVPCFQNGDHKNHDYSIIYTGGGCCDCGDDTAWKREGFCYKHKGAEQIQPLPDQIGNSVGPVLDSLFSCWKNQLLIVETMSREDPNVKGMGKVANELTYVVVEMLLDFCSNSESLLTFVSKRMMSTVGLVSLLVRAERFLSIDGTKNLHELLLKLLGEPTFKYEFAKVLVDYYSVPVAEVLRASSDNALKKYPLLSMFGVQIFTVPTLTPRLVKERDLLVVLLECLGEILYFCCAEDGRLQFNKWVSVFDTFIRVIEDIKFVVSHPVVAKYVTHERMDILEVWLQLLSLVQGANPQKRETGIHVEEENEYAHLPFFMCNSIAHIHQLLVKGAFCSEEADEVVPPGRERNDTDDWFSQRHAKVGRLSEESSACSAAAQTSVIDLMSQKFDGNHHLVVLPSVSQLMFDSLRAIDSWLAGSNVLSPSTSGALDGNILAFKKALSKVRNGKNISRLQGGSSVLSKHSSSIDVGSQYSYDGNSQAQSGMVSWPVDAGDLDYDSTLETETSSEKNALSLLSLSHWPDIEYDVSSQEMSVHMPLHALLSLILKEAIRNYSGENIVKNTSGSLSFLSPFSNDCDDFFGKLLKGCHPYGFSSFMMEHPLQNRVFCSQVRAGMWRKNGDTATVACEWYRAVRWSDHALELDLFLLQICAALAPADLYVTRLLERFQLSSYLTLDHMRSSEYEPVLVQDFITLLIQIVKERRFCGLTAPENLQRELVCKLATGDATHSQLLKSLPKDLAKLDQLQEVLDRVAQYSNPSGINQGKYSLRPAYWKELDLYYPCWNPRDLQIAEERYSRFCSISALGVQLPKWSNVFRPLRDIARIATCRSVLQIIRAVLFYSVFTDKSVESRAPDAVLISALHLLSLGLDVCLLERKSDQTSVHDNIPLLAFASEEIGMEMHNTSCQETLLSLLISLMRMHRKQNMESFMEAGNFNLSSLVENMLKKFAEIDSNCTAQLQKLTPEIINYQADEAANWSLASDSENRKMKARERQAAILAKMKAEQSKFLATLKSTSDTGSDDSSFGKEENSCNSAQQTEETHICCLCHDPSSKSPLSFLTMLQKSRLVSFVDRGPPSWDQDLPLDGLVSSVCGHERPNDTESLSSQLAQLVQGAINEFACQAHPAELSAFTEYLKLQFPEVQSLNFSGRYGEKREKISNSLESIEQNMYLSICKEITSKAQDASFSKLNQGDSPGEDAVKTYSQDHLLLGKYVAALKTELNPSQNGSSQRIDSAGNVPSYDGFGPMDCDGIHVSSCGHAIHQGCLDRYLSSLKERFTRRMLFEGRHIVDPDQGEFLCPVCRRLANSTLPAAPLDCHKLWEQSMGLTDSLPHSSGSRDTTVEGRSSFQLGYALAMLKTTATVVSRGDCLQALPLQRNRRLKPNLDPIFQVLTGMYFSGKQDICTRSGRVSPSVLMWDTLKYTVISTEIAARCGKSNMTSRGGINSLYSEFGSSGGFILPLLLRIIQSTRSKNLPDMLLRSRGIQLFAASICSGVSYDKCFRSAMHGEGNMLQILKYVDADVVFPDIQFWNEASCPVLTQDPFSTLIWVLFCLPYPFLSSRVCFISLVHLFYGVAVSQAIITYCTYSQQDVNQLGFDDCLVSDVAGFCGKTMAVKLCFLSNHVDPSSNINEVIHSLSLPYLRRCALMWKLLKSCAASPKFSRADELGKSLDMSDWPEASDILGDADEISKLQEMFEIPELEVVLKDGILRSMVFKWFHHLSEEFEDRGFQSTLHSTPNIPFKLMHLPLIYQELVQRYIRPRCPHCKAAQDDPALCLLCGRLCSPAWKPCCRESGCQAHAIACGAGTGVFLLIRKTSILLQRNARQAPWPSPYLDAFGEEDEDMHRGKPLFLNEERYAALTYMLLTGLITAPKCFVKPQSLIFSWFRMLSGELMLFVNQIGFDFTMEVGRDLMELYLSVSQTLMVSICTTLRTEILVEAFEDISVLAH